MFADAGCCIRPSDVWIPSAPANMCNYPWVIFPEGIQGRKAECHLKFPCFRQIPTYFKESKKKSKGESNICLMDLQQYISFWETY